LNNKSKTIRNIIIASLPFLILGIVFILPRPSVEIEPVRPKFWSYPDTSSASYDYSIDDSGKIHLHIEHSLLKNITPKMIVWWYKNLAHGVGSINDSKYPYYQLFHLSEHGQIQVLEPASDGTIGMGTGALIYRQETFGPFASKGTARIEQFDDNGFVAIPVMGPLIVGKVEHRFHQVEGGTIYIVDTILGSDIPVLGRLINLFIQNKRFSSDVIQQWIRHQVEEVGSLPNYLPKFYKEANL